MIFHSILFRGTADAIQRETPEAPAFFGDLNLDQIIDAITAGKQEYNLKPFFYTFLPDIETIQYRQAILRDLEGEALFEPIQSFAAEMRAMRLHLAQANKLSYEYQKERWFLEAVAVYCGAIRRLAEDLNRVAIAADGWLAFRAYVADYADSAVFRTLMAETEKLKADLATIQYCLLIKGNCIKVRRYEAEIDYSAAVEETFAKFRQGAVKDYRAKFPDYPDMNHVEAGVLDRVALLYPDIFAGLSDYCTKNGAYLDETIAVFDREVQFYLAYLEHIARFRQRGLPFCYPQVSDTAKEVAVEDGFDLALADKLTGQSAVIVGNDFYLKDSERILVVSGPNQGGKTTFARLFGQLHYLAGLGCLVPGRKARLFLCDRIFTHFEREEDLKNLRGKLQDDLVRIHDILEQATSDSIIIMNEIFTSTTLKDALLLGTRIMEEIIRLDLLCVCVTFIDEWAALSEKTVSMVSTVVPENPAQRTYKIIRRPADGVSYALSIAAKYRLTYDCVKERIKS